MNELSLLAFVEQLTLHGVIAGVFVLGFIATLLRGFSARDGSGYHKLCGALAILLFAMQINNSYFNFVAVVIGGLVVASEGFMIRLVSILRCNQSNIAAVVREALRINEEASQPVKKEEMPTLVMQTPKIGGPDAPKKDSPQNE